MDPILKALLHSNLVLVEYPSPGGFPTRGLFTRNINFIDEDIDEIVFYDGGFFNAYDVIREKNVFLTAEQELLGVSAYNPSGLTPSELASGMSLPTESTRQETIEKFKKTCGDIVTRGNFFELNEENKRVLLDFFIGDVAIHSDSEELDGFIEDLIYSRPVMRESDEFNAGFFLGMDQTFDSEEAALSYGAAKWISLINVYQALSLQSQELGKAARDIVSGILLPDPGMFKSYQAIVDYWPYALAPRPQETLVSSSTVLQNRF